MKEAPPRSWWKGLFGKYVISFVGLVVFLLVVNGGLESWFMYRDTTGLLVKAQSEKADATARRIEQFVSEVERQIGWATRASSVTSSPLVPGMYSMPKPTPNAPSSIALRASFSMRSSWSGAAGSFPSVAPAAVRSWSCPTTVP